MKKIIFLFAFVFCFCFFIFSPKVFAFEIIPDVNENYQTEDVITIRTSSILGKPSYVTETYDSKYCLKKRLYKYNVIVDMLLDSGKGIYYEVGPNETLSITNTFTKTSTLENIITNTMTTSVTSTFSTETGINGISKTGASATLSTTFGSSYAISESTKIETSETVQMTVSNPTEKKFYRLERRTKCIVYYVVEYTYNSPSKCWLQDCYYIFDANPNHYISLKRYKAESNKYIYDDVVDDNCYYFSYD